MIHVEHTEVSYEGTLAEVLAEITMLCRELAQGGCLTENDFDYIKEHAFKSRKDLYKELKSHLLRKKAREMGKVSDEIDSVLSLLDGIQRELYGESDD